MPKGAPLRSTGTTDFPAQAALEARTHGLQREAEIRRDRESLVSRWLEDRHSWQVHIDNFEEGEIVSGEALQQSCGTVSDELKVVLARYETIGAAGNPDKDACRSETWDALGVRIDGVRGRLDAPKDYILRLMSLTFFLRGHQNVDRK